ncbi:hypothetical protein [uncultured Nocardioides sp.]|jgi:hypothetical protein|uniref:hypothetical protein n=1 Tax=uncultured Nocardioides sp. TaxID=198441 RepID=UPI00261D5F2A|nr:hypothetical protein [uncultured Nocardioides sp.]MEC9052183.1 hypothetical protein [Actinomycetota bacterium]MEE3125647.1 hypothetical protein [Actinomycetota bacterium]
MCRPTTCKNCKKTTWAGCGQHVASVKAMVPADQWCNGDCAPAEGGQRTGVLGRLFGR